MMQDAIVAQVGSLNVIASPPGRGFNAQELADMAMKKLLYVSADAPPAIQDQAEAFKGKIYGVLFSYLAQAQKSQNTTIVNLLERSGYDAAANLVRKL